MRRWRRSATQNGSNKCYRSRGPFCTSRRALRTIVHMREAVGFKWNIARHGQVSKNIRLTRRWSHRFERQASRYSRADGPEEERNVTPGIDLWPIFGHNPGVV